MSLDKLEALETRVRKLVDTVHELKRTNTALEQDLQAARAHIEKQEEMSRRWEEERIAIRSRIEKVMGELEFLETEETS